jgi:hypothetical protein
MISMSSELDDLEEIKLAPRREGSAKKARAGHKRAMKAIADANKRPLWLRQLSRVEGWRKRKHV